MKLTDIKQLIVDSLNPHTDTSDIARRIEEDTLIYDFSNSFTDKVIGRIIAAGLPVTKRADFVRSLNVVFYRVALTGAAAIIILMISIFLMEGSFSLNSFLGLSDTVDESMISLLTGL